MKKIILAFLLIIAILYPNLQSFALSCAFSEPGYTKSDIFERYNDSDYVFIGKVIEKKHNGNSNTNNGYTKRKSLGIYFGGDESYSYKLKVLNSYKGNLKELVDTVDFETRKRSCGTFDYSYGSEYLVYANKTDYGSIGGLTMFSKGSEYYDYELNFIKNIKIRIISNIALIIFASLVAGIICHRTIFDRKLKLTNGFCIIVIIGLLLLFFNIIEIGIFLFIDFLMIIFSIVMIIYSIFLLKKIKKKKLENLNQDEERIINTYVGKE